MAIAGSTTVTEDNIHVEPHTATAPHGDATTKLKEEQDRHAESVIRANVYLSAASGLIPFPMIDTAASVAIDLKMLAELADVYRIEFRKDVGKSAIGAFLGTLGSATVGGAILGSYGLNVALSSVPVLGFAVRLVTQPALHGAFTFACRQGVPTAFRLWRHLPELPARQGDPLLQ
jgi:uncharacterized protein (DUF697 family)